MVTPPPITDWERYEAGADEGDVVGFAGDMAKLGVFLLACSGVLLFCAGVALGALI